MNAGSSRLPLVLIAAVAANGVIGGRAADGRPGLLWHLRSDLRRFKALSMGKPVIMGRKTFESIGRPLPGRETIVLTHKKQLCAAGVHVARDIDSAIAHADAIGRRMGAHEIVVAGGGEVYAQTISKADALHITEVDLAPEGSAFFPPIDPAVWREAGRVSPPRTPDDDVGFSFVDYARRDLVLSS